MRTPGRIGYQLSQSPPPSLLATALLDPCLVAQRAHAKRRGGEEGGAGQLPVPEERSGVAHFGGARGHGLHHAKGWHDMACGKYVHAQAPAAHGIDALGEAIGRDAGARQAFGP